MLIVFAMWRTTVSLRQDIQQEYKVFQQDLFQISSMTNKSIVALFKIHDFTEHDGAFRSEQERLLGLSQAVVRNQAIGRFINTRLMEKLPSSDPLMLHERLSNILPELQAVTAFTEELYKKIEKVESLSELKGIVDGYEGEFNLSIDSLGQSLNLQTQVRSFLFSNLQDNHAKTAEKLNNLLYTLVLLFISTLGIVVFHFFYQRRTAADLAASHTLLEMRVAERTSDLESSKDELMNEINERKLVENELRLKSDALENSLNGFNIINENQQFIYANKAYLNMWGYENLSALQDTTLAEHIQEPGMTQNILSTLKLQGKCVIECVAKRKDGTRFDALMYAILSQDEMGREIYLTTSIDISQRKKAEAERQNLERQLQHARKMEAVGTLSGGIAHEFNNVLGIILANVELALTGRENKDSVEEHLKEIRMASLRAKDVVQQLLSFSRKESESFQVLDVASLTEDAVGLLRASIPSDVIFDLQIGKECSNIVGDPTQFQQIIINLCNNGAHAMESEGGRLTITVTNATLTTTEQFYDKELNMGKYVVLRVKDTGCGIEKKVLNRIFDPFFTTKEVGQGSGMGLSVVHGLVALLKGGIRVSSEVGTGTCVEVYLPASSRHTTVELEEHPQLHGGSEQLLMVDDEERLLEIGTKILGRLGYRVTAHQNPVEALEEFRADPGKFDLVISDMTMPEMTGDRLIAEIRRLNPGQKVIICSGYSKRLNEDRAMQLEVDGFMKKPFGAQEIADAVRNTLDKSQRRAESQATLVENLN